MKHRVAIAAPVAERRVEPAAVRQAIAFAVAVDAIAAHVGPAAKELILSDHPRLPLPVVMRISRTHPDRQRFAIARAAEGRDPLGKPPPGTDPPFDTHNCAEVLSRLARNAGALVCAADGLLTTPFDGWPTEEKTAAICEHANAIRRAGRRMTALVRAVKLPTVEKPVHFADSVAAPPQGGACSAKEVLGAVARAAGVIAKNLRDLPRVLTDTPPSPSEREALLGRLRVLDAAAARLTAVLATRGQNTTGPFEVPGTYVVFFRLTTAKRVRIGALGTFDFPAGVYGYVGGAFGAGGVRKRTHRHLTRHSEIKTWNIDHLKPHGAPVEVWWTHDRRKVEFDWAAALAVLPGASIPARGFGSNDNPAAAAHLVRFADLPALAEFERRVRRRLAGHARVCRVTIEGWCGFGWPPADG